MPFVFEPDKEPDPILTSFPEGSVSEQFKELIKRAFREDRLWVMADPHEGDTFQGALKYGCLHQWINATLFTEEQLLNKFETRAFGLSIYWLSNLKIPLVYLRHETYQKLYGDAWHKIFLLLREAGISTAMLFNIINEPTSGPGLGLVFFSEGDAVLAQMLIDGIDFNSRVS